MVFFFFHAEDGIRDVVLSRGLGVVYKVQVYDQLTLSQAVSPNLTSGMVLTSLIGFTLIYALLMAADVYLLAKYAKTVPAHHTARH